MKRLAAVLLVTVLMITFLVGCGKDRLLYSNVKLENYVDVKDYKGVEIDTSSEDFAKYYDEIFSIDVEENNLYNEIAEGVVADGDIIKLDYEGKLDGVAFEGGTATDAELEIGSNTFIDDFEEELIGVAVGETKDVTAKFPENYGKEELNGKEAIFTCTVKAIKKPMTEEEAYSKLEFDSADEYKDNITKRAAKEYILDTITKSAKVKDYPQKDSELLCEAIYEFYVEIYKTSYNVNLDDIIKSNGSTVEEYKKQIAQEMVPQMMNTNMVMYYILDAEKIEILDSTLGSQSTEQPVIAESYAVQDTVMEFLYENANIK